MKRRGRKSSRKINYRETGRGRVYKKRTIIKEQRGGGAFLASLAASLAAQLMLSILPGLFG